MTDIASGRGIVVLLGVEAELWRSVCLVEGETRRGLAQDGAPSDEGVLPGDSAAAPPHRDPPTARAVRVATVRYRCARARIGWCPHAIFVRLD